MAEEKTPAIISLPFPIEFITMADEKQGISITIQSSKENFKDVQQSAVDLFSFVLDMREKGE